MSDGEKTKREIQSNLLEAQDRRRPGRSKSVSPSLIPLLRRPVPEGAEAEALLAEDLAHALEGNAALQAGHADADEPDDLAAMRGVAVALVFSVPLWVAILATVRFVF